MSRNKPTTTTETEAPNFDREGSFGPTKRAPALEGTDFASPILQLVKNILGRYVRHDGACREPCSCGLAGAVVELQHREGLLRRYGTE